jgi:hypothetical protein
VLASSQVNGMVVESPATMIPIGKNKISKRQNVKTSKHQNIKTSKHQNIKIFKNKQIT